MSGEKKFGDYYITVRRSSSGKALLFYDDLGRSYTQSIAWFQRLLSGEFSMLKLNFIGLTDPSRFHKYVKEDENYLDDFDLKKVFTSDELDQMDYKSKKARENNKVMVSEDF